MWGSSSFGQTQSSLRYLVQQSHSRCNACDPDLNATISGRDYNGYTRWYIPVSVEPRTFGTQLMNAVCVCVCRVLLPPWNLIFVFGWWDKHLAQQRSCPPLHLTPPTPLLEELQCSRPGREIQRKTNKAFRNIDNGSSAEPRSGAFLHFS